MNLRVSYGCSELRLGQVIRGGYGHRQNIPQVSASSLKSVQFLPELFVKMHPTD